MPPPSHPHPVSQYRLFAMHVIAVEHLSGGAKDLCLFAQRALRPATGIGVNYAEAIGIVNVLIESFEGSLNPLELFGIGRIHVLLAAFNPVSALEGITAVAIRNPHAVCRLHDPDLNPSFRLSIVNDSIHLLKIGLVL